LTAGEKALSHGAAVFLKRWYGFCADSVEYSDEPCDAYDVEQTPQGFRSTVSAPSLLYK
jgi:hypothetical protein